LPFFVVFLDLANDTRQGGVNGEKDGARPKRDSGGFVVWVEKARREGLCRGEGQQAVEEKKAARLDEKNKK
jgi:hypothetical protein